MSGQRRIMPAPDVLESYQRYLANCNARRFDLLGDFVHETLRLNGQVIPIARFADRLSALIETIPDYRWNLVDTIAGPDRIAVQIEATGTPRGEWHGVAANGNSVRVKEMAFYTYRDGRISEIAALFDLAAIRAQLS